MDKEDIGSRLRSLAKNDQRPKMARMRDIFDDIEKALKAKVPHLVLVEELKNSGLDVSLKVFRTMLLRIRKERELENSRNPAMNQPSPSALISENAPPKGKSEPQKPQEAIESQPKQPDVSDKQSVIKMDGLVKPMGGFKPQKQ